MKVALLAADFTAGAVLRVLLARAGVPVTPFRLSTLTPTALATRIKALRQAFTHVLLADAAGAAPEGALSLDLAPSLESWLTRDPEANQKVLGTREVPTPEGADRWLRARVVGAQGRSFSLGLDGSALAAQLDLGLLAAAAPSFRSLLASLQPNWAAGARLPRRRGRPAGVAMFRGSGYTLCLELLHLGDRAEVTPAALGEALKRTRTPVLRLVQEAQRRGYLRRRSARGALTVRDADRLLEELVTDVRARRAARRPEMLPIGVDRDPAGLPRRLGERLAEHGRVLALTGAFAIPEYGGDSLAGGPVLAYAHLKGITSMLGDAFVDERRPRLLLIEPEEDGMLHRLSLGAPARVSPWQAVIDLLASSSEREREIGNVARRALQAAR
jgi:hypothetical protein